MSTLGSFAEALLAAEPVCPPGLTAWNGSAPEKRFAVYRNNVIVGLVDALADSFPVAQALVGEEFFRAMAREFARRFPPLSPVLALYGDGFAEFIESFPPARTLPYLNDVARLELLRVRAWHAADADPIDMADLSALLSDPENLPEACFALHPSLSLLASRHAIVSLWAAHQEDSVAEALAAVDPGKGEVAMICRKGLEVEIRRIDDGDGLFLARLQEGTPVGKAMAQASAACGHFDPANALALLLQAGAITGITIPRRTHP